MAKKRRQETEKTNKKKKKFYNFSRKFHQRNKQKRPTTLEIKDLFCLRKDYLGFILLGINLNGLLGKHSGVFSPGKVEGEGLFGVALGAGPGLGQPSGFRGFGVHQRLHLRFY